jgi:pilus assembly protein CpaF
MRLWYNNVVDTQRRLVEVEGDRITIGRDESSDLVLASPYIAPEALVLYRRGTGWEVVVHGNNGVRIGDRQLSAGEHCEIHSRSSIELFPFTITVDLPTQQELSEDAQRQCLDQQMSRLIAETHRELLDRMDLRQGIDLSQHQDDIYLLKLEQHIETIARGHASMQSDDASGASVSLLSHLAGCAVRDRMLRQLYEDDAAHVGGVLIDDSTHWNRMVTAVPQREQELTSTANYLAGVLDLSDSDDRAGFRIDAIQRDFWMAWTKIHRSVHDEFKDYLAMRLIKKEIKDIVFGYGPLEDLLRMKSVSEIMVVDRDHIFVESSGVIEDSGRRFISDDVVESINQRIVGKVGRRIDQSQPLVDARLADGSRVNAVIAPLAVSGPTLTIRKFPERRILIHDLVALGTLSKDSADFLRALVRSRRNLIVSGGTGTGKTTLLNCLSDFIPDGERIVTIEDTAELQLSKAHVVRMETKNANVEGAGEYSIRDLVRNALRMRPDRIVVGECRGPESLDMLQAMNTGHDGSLTTIHANDAHDVSLRLEVLVQMAADLPVTAIREQIGSAIDVIVQLQRHRDGRRLVTQITECVGVNRVTGQLDLRDLFTCPPGADKLYPTGQLPTFIESLLDQGDVDLESFY